MTITVGRGGQCVSMVGIYGWQCVCRDLRTWWDTEMRLGGAQVVVVGRDSVMLTAQNALKQSDTSRGADGHSSHSCEHGAYGRALKAK